MKSEKSTPLQAGAPAEGARMIITMTTDELRALIREAIAGNALPTDDRLVEVDEAARILNVSEDWLYHNWKKLPFARKLGHKLLKFSVGGMNRWIAGRSV